MGGGFVHVCECVCLQQSLDEKLALVIAKVLFNHMNSNLGLFLVNDSMPVISLL